MKGLELDREEFGGQIRREKKFKMPRMIKKKVTAIVPPIPPPKLLAFQENVFATPWKKSNIVFVVKDAEFHVHSSILTLQSPVFEAMLNGHFKEANQDKITLKGKNPEDMLQFLKLLYPANMIKKPLLPFTSGDGALKMLALADEYQAEDVMNQCLVQTKISQENVFKILPYATKYNQCVRGKCINAIKERMPTKNLEKKLPGLQDQKLVQELLTAKCHYLESRLPNKGISYVSSSFDSDSDSDV